MVIPRLRQAARHPPGGFLPRLGAPLFSAIMTVLLTKMFTKDIKTVDDLLIHGLKDIYYPENQIVKSLPKLIDKATNRDLGKGLEDHLEETARAAGDQLPWDRRAHCGSRRCRRRGCGQAGPRCRDRRRRTIRRALRNRPLWDLIAWADELGRDDVVRLLTINLNEEKAADKKLSTVALRKGVNRRAES